MRILWSSYVFLWLFAGVVVSTTQHARLPEEWVFISRFSPRQHAAEFGFGHADKLWSGLVRWTHIGDFYVYTIRSMEGDDAHLWFSSHRATHGTTRNVVISIQPVLPPPLPRDLIPREFSTTGAASHAHSPLLTTATSSAACRTNAGATGTRGYSPGGFSWAVDRSDQHTNGMARIDGTFCTGGGASGTTVHVYVLDTGVADHDTFIHPVAQDYSWFASLESAGIADTMPPSGTINATDHNNHRHDHIHHGHGDADFEAADGDCHGHGTHVAGLIASSVYGVAPDVQVHAVQVLGCDGSGTFDALIAGLLYVYQYAETPAVVNLSLGAPDAYSSSISLIIGNIVNERGIPVIAAAGNSAMDACRFFPAQLADVLAVAASDSSDSLAAFSNRGVCIDMTAPGSDVISCLGDGTGAIIRSGTSMAAPLVAGGMALLQAQYPTHATDVAWLRALLVNDARVWLRGSLDGTPNLLFQAVPDVTGPPALNATMPPLQPEWLHALMAWAFLLVFMHHV